MMSLSTMGRNQLQAFKSNVNSYNQSAPPQDITEIAKMDVLQKAGMEYFAQISPYANDVAGMYKSKSTPAYGSINKPKGMIEPPLHLSMSYDARGLRQKYFNLSHRVLREAARRTMVIGSIQQLRCMQVRPFSHRSPTDDDLGFRARLKDKTKTPDRKDKKIMAEIEEFFRYSGYTDFIGSEEREEGLTEVLELVTREVMTIDQIAISLQRNRKGKVIGYWVLDGATIRRVSPDVGFDGDKKIKFAQEVQGRIVETFTGDDMIFTYMNRVTDIYRRGWGYSFLEMSIDFITAWLFAMSYNKEQFNSGSQPRGFISFDGDGINQESIEELQREWISMFRGIKGAWRTPFLRGAKWNNIGGNNRDMQYNEYVQILAAWLCALHGTDPAELGIKFNRTQKALFENEEKKIAYSKSRGLKDLLTFHESWINKIKDQNEEWRDYWVHFTGIEATDQMADLAIDEKQTQTYMLINEKRKEKDLPPIEGGDIINSQVFLQAKQMEKMEGQGGEGFEDEEVDEPTFNSGNEKPETTPKMGKEEFKSSSDKELDDAMLKSKDNFIDIIVGD